MPVKKKKAIPVIGSHRARAVTNGYTFSVKRREFLKSGGAVVGAVAVGGLLSGGQERKAMYGRIVKIDAAPGQRDTLIETLLSGSSAMPGCLSYVVAKDATDANAIWVTEVWDSEASHKASLALPSVKEAIAKGRPLIAGFGQPVITEPVGGQGLKK